MQRKKLSFSPLYMLANAYKSEQVKVAKPSLGWGIFAIAWRKYRITICDVELAFAHSLGPIKVNYMGSLLLIFQPVGLLNKF